MNWSFYYIHGTANMYNCSLATASLFNEQVFSPHVFSIFKATALLTMQRSIRLTIWKKKVTQSAICSLHCTADVQTKLTSHSFSKHLGILWSIRSPDTDLKSVESDVSRWLLFPFGRDGVIAPGRHRPWGPLGHFVFFVFFWSIRQMGKLLFVERPCCFGSSQVSDWLCHCAGACDWN